MPDAETKGCSIIGFPDDYTIVDLETTGLSPCFDEIIELAALKVVRGEVVARFQSLIRPECPISEFITSLTGISNEMVADAPVLADVICDFVDFIGSDIVVGHNVAFDIGFIRNGYRCVADKCFANDYIDTVRIARKVFPVCRIINLGRFGIRLM